MNEQWVDAVWSDPVWNPNDSYNSGNYDRFAFQMNNGFVVQPADANGIPWAAVPQFGIPAVKVNGLLWPFSAADAAATYDYYSGPAAGSYLWITGAFYGGYDPGLGNFAGTNSSGYFRDTSGTGVLVTPRNSNGSLLSIGSPDYGSWQIWSNGFRFRFMTTDITNGVDVYCEETSGFVYVHAPVDGIHAVSGLVTGTYANSNFQGTATPAFAGEYDGSPLPAGSTPVWGRPPAVYVINAKWSFRGKTSTADYYGGDRPGQMLSIAANGAVFFSDRSLNFSNASGLYAGGVFQNLPVVVRGVKADGSPWSSRFLSGSHASFPESVLVAGRPWYFSITQSTTTSRVYLGPQSGQSLAIFGTTATLIDPATSTYLTGTYADGKFSFTGSTVSVKKGRADGTPFDPFGTLPTLLEGNVDLTGNTLSLGSWTDTPANSGLVLSFQDGQTSDTLPVSEVSFLATRQRNVWSWGHSNATLNGAIWMMQLDAEHRLKILAPPPSTAGPIVLDPVGTSRFEGRVRFDGPVYIAPQGDIPMFVAPTP